MGVVQECEPASFVLIAVPTHTCQVATTTMMSIVGGYARLMKLGVKVAVTCVEGQAYIQHARNIIIKGFLESPATDLLFIDYDVGFEPDAMVRITQARRPFVAGAYPLKTEQPEWHIAFKKGGIVEPDAEGLLNPAEVMTGFLRLNRAVFEDFDCGDYLYEGETFKEFFRCGPVNNDGVFMGEDVDFCRRWGAQGGNIHMIPDLTFSHMGVRLWVGNWANSFKRED
jgi:hypothetical protein